MTIQDPGWTLVCQCWGPQVYRWLGADVVGDVVGRLPQVSATTQRLIMAVVPGDAHSTRPHRHVHIVNAFVVARFHPSLPILCFIYAVISSHSLILSYCIFINYYSFIAVRHITAPSSLSYSQKTRTILHCGLTITVQFKTDFSPTQNHKRVTPDPTCIGKYLAVVNLNSYVLPAWRCGNLLETGWSTAGVLLSDHYTLPPVCPLTLETLWTWLFVWLIFGASADAWAVLALLIHTCASRKHIFLEKPLTFCIQWPLPTRHE